jgi:hypothetical protein
MERIAGVIASLDRICERVGTAGLVAQLQQPFTGNMVLALPAHHRYHRACPSCLPPPPGALPPQSPSPSPPPPQRQPQGSDGAHQWGGQRNDGSPVRPAICVLRWRSPASGEQRLPSLGTAPTGLE